MLVEARPALGTLIKGSFENHDCSGTVFNFHRLFRVPGRVTGIQCSHGPPEPEDSVFGAVARGQLDFVGPWH